MGSVTDMTLTRNAIATDMDRSQDPIVVVLAEEHASMRRSLRQLLEGTAGMHVAAEAGDLALAAQHVAGHRPDVFVVALHMPDGSSLQAVEELRVQMPQTAVVVMSVEDAPGFAQRALAAGANGYVLKEHADTELPDAVRAVSRGEQYVSPAVGRRLAEMRRALTGGLLSTRETEVLRLVALGHTNLEIAAQLGVSPRTIETHRAHVQSKLGVRTRAELVRYAMRRGLLAT